MENPEEYAVKNWIVQMQGFLINCATYGFTSNYEKIMDGEYGYDLFHGTYGEKLMNLLGDNCVPKSDFLHRSSIRWRWQSRSCLISVG